MRKKISLTLITAMMMLTLAACGTAQNATSTTTSEVTGATTEEATDNDTNAEVEATTEEGKEIGTSTDVVADTGTKEPTKEVVVTANVTSSGMIDASDMFTDRDLTQTADLSEAEYYTVSDGKDITISEAGVYVLSGSAKDVTVYVEADAEAKVQLVLDGVTITNETQPCIYVKSADKVFVTTTETENSLTVEGSFEQDDDTNLDAVIFSKEDLVINGLGTLSVTSSDNGISSKDTLKVTGGELNISCSGSALEAHDAIEIADGILTITDCNDGLHAKDSDDDSKGYIYICGGTFNINASDDAIHGTTVVQLDGGEFILQGGECIEGTYIQINDGTVSIEASDDGINAAQKSSQYTPTFEMNGGEVTIVMGAGDTDGVDSNGNIYINGGTIDISGQSTFDYDGTAEYNGGSIIENGTETNTITNQFMGGPGGGPGGDMGGEPSGNFGGGFPDDNFGGGPR